MNFWAPLALGTATGTLLVLPLAPALRELRLRRDAAALPIQQHDANIDNFAKVFRQKIEPLQGALAEVVARGTIRECTVEDGNAVLVGIGYTTAGPALHDCEIRTVTLYACPVVTGDDVLFLRETYAACSLRAGTRNTFRAILCDGDLDLAEHCRVLRWVHAEGRLTADQHCELYGRTSSAVAIALAAGCRFERVYAPKIVTGSGPAPLIPPPDTRPGSTISARRGRLRLEGDLRLRDGEALQGDSIARSVRLGEQCLILGSMKSGGDLIIGDGSFIDGSIIANGSLRIGRGCFVRGPVLAEGEIEIGSGSHIGAVALATTITAPRIRVHSHCVIYGTLWARAHGQIEE